MNSRDWARSVFDAFSSSEDSPPDTLCLASKESLKSFSVSELVAALDNISWRKISEGSKFFKIAIDPVDWTAYLPKELWLYYLPAMLIVAAESEKPQSENLRGMLIGYLDPDKYATERHIEFSNYVYQNITQVQQNIIDQFLSRAD